MAPYVSPRVTQSSVGPLPPGCPWGSGGCGRVCVLCWFLPPPFGSLSAPATARGFIRSPCHPLASPHSSQGPSFFPRMPKDEYEQRFFSSTLRYFYRVPLLLFYVPLLRPAVQSSSAAPGSAAPALPLRSDLAVSLSVQFVFCRCKT